MGSDLESHLRYRSAGSENSAALLPQVRENGY
ncbi:hypothetical protein M2359_001754 [Gordonia amarae]|nr:hypothetical protein [Gordonia amarae]